MNRKRAFPCMTNGRTIDSFRFLAISIAVLVTGVTLASTVCVSHADQYEALPAHRSLEARVGVAGGAQATATRSAAVRKNVTEEGWVDATSGPLGDNGAGYGVAWGDYDNDGDLDLYLANYGEGNKLFRNEGDGTFTDATTGPLGGSGSGFGVAWGDYDKDGNLDLYLVNANQANALLHNEGDGTFTDATSALLGNTGPGRGAAWGDYDNDGDLDLYLVNYGEPNKLFRNEGGGTFVDGTTGPLGDSGNGTGVAWGDYDNDGDLDLYLVNVNQANALLQNEGDGTFIDVTTAPLGDTGPGSGVTFGDYDNDGDLDLYLANNGAANKLFRNETTGNHWLQVNLVGVVSNASGIGAWVRVVAGGQSQIREVSGGSGYCSQNSLPVEFGLGAATTVDSLILSWPSGVVQESLGVAADQVVWITEESASGLPDEPLPTALRLYGSCPNTANASVIIRYDLPAAAAVKLRIYNVNGRLVRALIDSKKQVPGSHWVVWNGRNDHGHAVESGAYFYRLEAGCAQRTGRTVILRR